MKIVEKLKINSSDIVSETIDGEVVIVNLQKGDYYSLLRTATDIWSAIEKGTNRQSLIEHMLKYYNASPEEMTEAINRFVEVLQKEGLITVEEIEKPRYESPSLIRLLDPSEKPNFEWPEIEKFTDMEDLLLLDPIHEADEATGWPNAKDSAA